MDKDNSKMEDLLYIKTVVAGSNTIALVINNETEKIECRLNGKIVKRFNHLNDDSVGYFVNMLAENLNKYVASLDIYCITDDDEGDSDPATEEDKKNSHSNYVA